MFDAKGKAAQEPLQDVTGIVMSAAVIFDLDGTLADTSQDLLNAANKCFEELGYEAPLTKERDMATAFRGGRKMLSLGIERLTGQVDHGFVQANYKNLLRHYETGIADHTVFYEGAPEAVAKLRHLGIRTAICTNKPEYLALDLINRLGASDWFEVVLGADSLPVNKPDPAHYFGVLEEMGFEGPSMLVGDTVTDLKTAEAANVPCILYDSGALEDAVNDYSPAARMTDYRDLHQIVEQILETHYN